MNKAGEVPSSMGLPASARDTKVNPIILSGHMSVKTIKLGDGVQSGRERSRDSEAGWPDTAY